MGSLVSNIHSVSAFTFDTVNSFLRFSHMSVWFRLTVLRVCCTCIQFATSLGMRVEVRHLSSSVLACLMTVTLHTLLYAWQGNILPSDSPGKSARHRGGGEGVFVDDSIQPWHGSPLIMMEGADQMHVVLF